MKKVEDVEEKEIVDEISLRENDNEETDFEDLMDAVDDYFEPNTPEHKKLMDAVENALNNGEIDTMDFSHSPAAPSKAVRMIAKEMGMDERLNESFLYMQKLAGLITEAQYQAKKKVLNEGTRYFVVVNFKGQSDELGNMHGIEASDKNDLIQKFENMFNDDISSPQQSYTFYEVSNKEAMNKIEQMSDKWEGGEDTSETKYLQNIADKAKHFDEINPF